MKTVTKYLSDTKVELTITLEPSELQKAEQVALKKLSRDIKVPGFRKGKVPMSVAEKHINPSALQEQTLENALSKAVAEAFLTEDIQALERPAVEVKKYVPGQELEFTAEAQIVPKIKLASYKNLKAKKQPVKVEAKEVDEIIERMQQSFATKNEVDRAAKLGDEVLIDFVGKKDDKAFDGGTAKDYSLKLGEGQFIPGFEDGVVGKKPGDKFDLDLKFPKDYHAKDLADQKVVFEVVLHKVNEVALPELNDEFAAKCGPFTDVKGLKDDIKREVTAQKERDEEDRYKDNLIGELAEATKVALPELLVQDQIQSIEQDMTQNLMYRGLTLDSYLTTQKYADKEAWLEKEVRPAAEKRVKAGLIIAELSKELKVDVSRDELLEQINNLKQQYGKDKQTLEQLDNPNVHRDIANRLVTDKTIAELARINSK